ncbi:MAG: PD-(D/E)XK nuclease family protein [Clostridiales bacterium]|nr:PD-(D/E)XK nuclease family protein [Clostridiales bacterium]
MVKHICKLSVHEFVEKVVGGGDLVFSGTSMKRMQEGTQIHSAIQKESIAQSEVLISYNQLNDTAGVEISGRIDLLHDYDDSIIIEELKSTHQKLSNIKQPEYSHMVQAKCYAGMYCHLHKVSSIEVKVTYISAKTMEHIEFSEIFNSNKIKAWLRSKCDEILLDITQDIIHKNKRNESASTLSFPYKEFRKGQRNMSGYVYLASRDSYINYICAPTGIGKTMAALYPSIRSLGEAMGDKVFYLTSKNTIKQIAAQSMKILYESGFWGRSVTLTAKSKICPHEQQICHPMFCAQAAGYYDRLPDALEELLSCGHYGYDEVTAIAEKHNICPFELSLDFSLKCDIIICDYNYAFDPTAHLKRYFDDGGDYILLIDEAHNLVDRARDMFSVDISKKEILALKKILPKSPDKIEKKIKGALTKLNKVLLELRKALDSDGIYAQTYTMSPDDLSVAVSSFIEAAEPLIDSRIRKPYSSSLFDLFFNLKRFQAAAKNFDSYCICFAERKYNDLSFKILCIDPSSRLQATYDKTRSAVLFSASLTPFTYFNRLLSTQEVENYLLPSPFPHENLKVLINSQISTRYIDRQTTATDICKSIYAFISSLSGNHLIFFPSYQYMGMIYELFLEMYNDIDCAIQSRRMSEDERINFLSAFDEEHTSPFACFVVMGGIFSEGIDLVGDRLIGAVIVSVGLPQVCFERDLIKAYHMEHEEHGFHYAYTYPGFNKIVQSVGRIIRTAEDKGAALLIGQRFSHSTYTSLMPNWWHPLYHVSTSDDIKKALNQST